MEKTFDFKTAEAAIYKKCQDTNAFRADVNSKKPPYTTIMPPPNVTARLHVGHAFEGAIQDTIARYKRMQGFEVLYLPGADHAAIATEVKIVEELKKQGINKADLTRAQFMEHVDKWYKIYIAEIKEQFKRMGLSVDWSRFSFTMDKSCADAVNAVFNNLYKKGLIYKGKRMVNVCKGCKSALSDAEIEYKPQERKMYHVRYNLSGGTGGIVVATVRPETIYGDTAICVNPKDKRYTKYIGLTVINPLTNTKIPVIADDYVDMKFGTGALKITPAHDHADNEIGARHNLETIIVPDELLDDRTGAIKKLRDTGALVKEVKYTGNVAVCYRCGTPVEPTISTQWFVAMGELAKPCIRAIETGELKITPKKYEKIYLHWLKNIKDWCISRQLTSGHRIPVAGETDVLDTWFSSGLWAFCTLGWTENSADFKRFYPTQTIVMGYEIIFFWAIRMIFQSIEATGKCPFENLLIHGIVRDDRGRKMSKSLGNGIDPVKVVDEFGVDAMRFSLIAGTKLDRDPRYSIEKATLARNFINKIWNATKYYTVISGDTGAGAAHCLGELRPVDKWILTKLNNLTKSVTKKYEKFDFGVAANEMQHFFWADFCDWYVEESKQTKNIAVYEFVLCEFLKLISPIMPFVTEHIWCDVLNKKQSIYFEPFPTENKKNNFPRDAKEFEQYIERIKTERNAKTEAENRVKIITTLEKEIQRGENMLKNAGFVQNAPKALVDKEREKLNENKSKLTALLILAGSRGDK